MIAKIKKAVVLPKWGYTHLSTEVCESRNGRNLIIIRGFSGQSTIDRLLLTVPTGSIQEDDTKNPCLNAGVYSIKNGEDRKGNSLLKLYYSEEDGGNLYLFGVEGKVIEGGQLLAHVYGRSRTGRQSSNWSLLCAKEEEEILIDYYGDHRVFIVENGELKPVAGAALLPSDW